MTISIKQYQEALEILESDEIIFHDDMIETKLRLNIKLFDKAMLILGYDGVKSGEIWNNEVKEICEIPKNGCVDGRLFDPDKIPLYALREIIKKIRWCYALKQAKQLK